MDANFYKANRQRFLHEMAEGSLLLFSGKAVQQSADSYYPFFVNRNFYYMTGINIANEILMIVKNSDTPQETLYIPDPEKAPPGANNFPLTAKDAAQISGIPTVSFLEKFIPQLQNLMTGTRRNGIPCQDITTVYADMERQTFDSATGTGGLFVQKMRERYPYLYLADAYRISANYRRVKNLREFRKFGGL